VSDTAATYDVAIIGAGAAGLAAAAVLARARCSVVMLEARGRIGGRICTRTEPGLPYPLELGAEFIHGRSPETFALARESGVAIVDTAGSRWTLREGRLTERGETIWGELQRLMHAVDALAEPDLSVDAYLSRYARDPALHAAAAQIRMMAEGFDAADPAQASVRALAREWTGGGLGGQFRPAGGYGPLLEHLRSALGGAGSRLLLEHVVRAVTWSSDGVTLDGTGPSGAFRVRARRALVTLPLGILKLPDTAADAVRFDPPLAAKQTALRGLAFGPVVKVVLRFRSAFWDALDDGQYAEAGFLHAADAPFPTLWTALPYRVPLLTAWVGGPRAARLAASGSDLGGAAVDSVQGMFGPRVDVRRELLAAYTHDWPGDPFARGAYSYVTVGGLGTAAELARPLEETLFFAGEATHPEETGTVEAALQSGTSAARLILAAYQV